MFKNLIEGFESVLPIDKTYNNAPRQTPGVSGASVLPKVPSKPRLEIFSDDLVERLGLDADFVASEMFLQIVSGSKILEGSLPFAMNYAGHQFGNWAGQLGDGRAINLFDLEHHGHRWSLQLKGAGRTAYSRTADGYAVLRSSIREFLCSEAMFHLGVPTTRALSLVTTGDQVMRDMMYDGNPNYEQGAIVCRVAPSFIRFGNFEVHASRQEFDILRQLADFTIDTYFPEITDKGELKYHHFYHTVCEKTLQLMLEWHRVGFVHGVMNTDNMSILGLTIDYGPYGWTDDYNYQWTPNTTDRAEHRYRFGNQANIALWNLVRLANALVPLVDDQAPFQKSLEWYQSAYKPMFVDMMTSKVGLFTRASDDENLITRLEKLMHRQEVDMTIFFRSLSTINIKDTTAEVLLEHLGPAFYQSYEPVGSAREDWLIWFTDYIARSKTETIDPILRKERMDKINPKYVLRNYMAQMAIEKAETGDFNLVHELYKMLKTPYQDQPSFDKYFALRPDWAKNKVGASMLSCSS